MSLFFLPLGIASVFHVSVFLDLLCDVVLLLEALFVLRRVKCAVGLVVSFVALDRFWRNVPTQGSVVPINVVLVVQSDFDGQGSHALSDCTVVKRGQVCNRLDELRHVAVFEGDAEVTEHVNRAVDANVEPVELASHLVDICDRLLEKLYVVHDVVSSVEAVGLRLVVLLHVLVLQTLR